MSITAFPSLSSLSVIKNNFTTLSQEAKKGMFFKAVIVKRTALGRYFKADDYEETEIRYCFNVNNGTFRYGDNSMPYMIDYKGKFDKLTRSEMMQIVTGRAHAIKAQTGKSWSECMKEGFRFYNEFKETKTR